MAGSFKVAVIGANGQLGSELMAIAGEQAVALSHRDIEVTDRQSVLAALRASGAEVVINTAAFHHLETCAKDPEKAFAVNALGASNVAWAARELGMRSLFISTDYVFGRRPGPHTEESCPGPVNVYGVSKLAGEELVLLADANAVVVRVAGLYGRAGASGKGGNFIEAILGRAQRGETLRVVSDQRTSPTYAKDAAEAILALAVPGKSGIYHVTNQGNCTWYELAQAAVKQVGFQVPVVAISSREFPSPVLRPADSSLVSLRAEPLRRWEDALLAYLNEKQWLSPSS